MRLEQPSRPKSIIAKRTSVWRAISKLFFPEIARPDYAHGGPGTLTVSPIEVSRETVANYLVR